MSSSITVGVVDDHPLMREGVVHCLRRSGKFEVVAEGASADDAVAIAERHAPELILLDVNMPGGGVEAVARILARFPNVKLIMLTVTENFETVCDAMDNGARGYVLKGISSDELIEILLTIHGGDAYVTPQLAARLLSRSTRATHDGSKIADLSVRETEILSDVAKGMTNKEIGRRLNLSEKTVKHYMTNVMQKLSVRNRMEAALALRKVNGG